MAGIQKLCLNNLNTNFSNALIVGIIIAKNSPRIIGNKKKNGDMRGVTSFTLRDSEIDTINCDVWGSEYFILTFYDRFLVGDVVEISSPKILVKKGDDHFKPHVSSPFYLSLNEGQSEICIHSGDTFRMYLPLLHVPTKACAGYYGLSEILKLPEGGSNLYVDLLVVVKAVKPAKTIKTKHGTDMKVRSVEITDNTTPATVLFEMFDSDTIQRAEEWRPLESVLFIADARVSWRARCASVQVCSRTVVTHQPFSADAESLRLYMRNLSETRGGEAAAWAAWSGERASAVSVAQLRDRLQSGAPFCSSLHAILTHLELNELNTNATSEVDEIRVRFADHTGEIGARLPIHVLEQCMGCSIAPLSADERAGLRRKVLLEHCTGKLAASPQGLLVVELRLASPADPIPLY